MAKNVEIKASIENLGEFLARTEALVGSKATSITQHDTFFNCPSGRLKLREFSDATGQLIAYQRADHSDPTASSYSIYPTNTPNVLKEALSSSLGVSGEIKKIRHLCLLGRTRIHIDEVESLGSFVELEVVMGNNDTESAAIEEAHRLMDKLGIQSDHLVEQAYVDLVAET